MNLKNEFNRLTGMFDQRVDQMHNVADDLRAEARRAARRAQHGLAEGKQRFASLEETMERAVRERPQFFVLGVICLLALILTKVMLDQTDRRRPM